MEDDHVVEGNLEEALRLRDRPAGLVHVGAGLEQKNPLAAKHSFRRRALKPLPPRRGVMGARDGVEGHEADVVAVAGGTGGRVAGTPPHTHYRKPKKGKPPGPARGVACGKPSLNPRGA